jgi:ribonuclease T1
MQWCSSIKWVLTGFLLGALSGVGGVQAKGAAPGEALATVTLAELPRQGAQTYALILQGGPFAYEKDGTVFGNRERLLPAQKRGYYREYTVPTPGARTRGARRIVCGGQQAKAPETCYYTADHYASFRRIVP